MKIKTIILVYFIFAFHSSFAQPIFEKWATLKEYNSSLTHALPPETGNLEYIKSHPDDLLKKLMIY